MLPSDWSGKGCSLNYTISSAVLSPDGVYRYALKRVWCEYQPSVTFIMLNPSTADADTDDPTIHKCCAYARKWGCGGIDVVNLFAARATNPGELLSFLDPVGPDNDLAIRNTCGGACVIVLAWGRGGKASKIVNERARFVLKLLQHRCLCALRVNSDGSPAHPLYLPGDLMPVIFRTPCELCEAPVPTDGGIRVCGKCIAERH